MPKYLVRYTMRHEQVIEATRDMYPDFKGWDTNEVDVSELAEHIKEVETEQAHYIIVDALQYVEDDNTFVVEVLIAREDAR